MLCFDKLKHAHTEAPKKVAHQDDGFLPSLYWFQEQHKQRDTENQTLTTRISDCIKQNRILNKIKGGKGEKHCAGKSTTYFTQ